MLTEKQWAKMALVNIAKQDFSHLTEQSKSITEIYGDYKEEKNEKSKRNFITDIFPAVKVWNRMFLKGCV